MNYVLYIHQQDESAVPKSDAGTAQLKEIPMSKQAKTFAPSAMNIAVAESIVQSLDALSQARENWEQTAFKKANDGLYDLLSQCLAVFETKFVKGTKDDQKTLRSELISRLNEMNIRTLKTSTTLNMFVRFVFRSDRKRAHGYSYVLNAAISHEVTAAQLPQWIVSEGGIEEIKRKMVQSDESKERQAKRKQAKDTAEQLIAEAHVNPLATVAVDGFMPNQRNIMLAVGDVNGNFNVTYVLTEVSDSLYNALLKQAAKKIVEADEQDSALTTEAAKLKNRPAANDQQLLKQAA